MINKKQQSGMGLVEVLVTALILGGSLMALASLQNRSLQFNYSAYMRSQANIVAYDMMERIRISTPQTGAAAALGTEELADLVSSLPTGAEARVENCENRVCTIAIQIPDEEGADPGGTTTTFNYITLI